MKRVIVCLALAALFAPATARAQQGSAEIRGKVMDAQGAVLPGVTVTIRHQNSGIFRETVSSDDGSYFIGGVTPGPYEVLAELSGFKKFSRRDVQLEIGKTLAVDVPLSIGGVEEVVDVKAESPIVDLGSKEVGGNITNRELVELPSVNRNFIGFVGLLPGIVPSISTESFGSDSVSVNGQDSRNNNYMLDGANNNDDVIGQRAGTQARTAIESIQEFQVITNQFDAEFGRTVGAIINAVSKQGTNKFKGSGFSFFQDARLTRRDYFAEQLNRAKPDTKQTQVGGTIGGPIIPNKAHFFFSLERVLVDRGTTINIPARPEFNTTTTTQDRVWNTLVRFDNQINANHSWGVRWLKELSPQRNQIVGNVTLAANREEDDKDQTVVASLTSVLGNSKLNSVRVAWTQEDVAFANPGFNGNGRDQAALLPTLAFQTFTDQQANVAQARVNDAIQIEDTFSWFLPGKGGDHDLKFGVQFEYLQANSIAQDNLNGTFSFGLSNAPFNANDPRTWPERLTVRVPGAGRTFTKAQYFALFGQDKWGVTDRLTLSLGFRYDLESMPFVEADNPAFSDPNKYPVDKNNFQPRVGFAYNMDSVGRSVLRGGYGIFYDKTHLELIQAVITAGVFADSFTVNFPRAGIDPGPRAGNLPTDPYLVNGPTVNRARLAQEFPAGVRNPNTGAITFDNPDRVVPYTHQITVGFERQLFSNTSASVDYVRSLSRDMLMNFNLNPGLRPSTAVTAAVANRPNTTRVDVITPVNVGEMDYDALQMQFEKRFSHNYSVRAAYTLAKGRGNTSGNGRAGNGFQVLDQMNLDRNVGPTDFDRRHNFVVSGTMIVPHTYGLNVSGVVRALSGTGFSVTNNTIDPDRNGSQSEPLPVAEYKGAGVNGYEVTGYEATRNGARGPGFFQVDMRLGYRFRLGGIVLEPMGEIFNVTNRANFANPTGDQSSVNFLVLTGLRPGGIPRTGQLAMRVSF